MFPDMLLTYFLSFIIIIIGDAILAVIRGISNWSHFNIIINNKHSLILKASVPKDVIPK